MLLPIVACVLLSPPAAPTPTAVAGGGETADDAARAALGARIDAWLSTLERFGFHAAVLVADGDEVLVREGYGIAEEASGRPITARTVFDLGSLGKQFTAAAVLRLAMDGRLAPEDTLDRHLPDVPPDKRGITVHHLLTHTSGLPYMPGSGRALDLPLQSAPGERWSYSNPGYALLAAIVDSAAGRPFEEYVREEVFARAGLEQTRFRGDPGHPADCAHAYTDGTEQGSAGDGSALPPGFRGAGGVTSCLDDLWSWEHALRTNAVLSPEWTERLFAEHVRNPGSRVGYAYGWMTAETERGTRVVFHGGNLGGFNTDFRRYVDEGWTLAVLSNHFDNGRSMRDAVSNDLARLLAGGEVRTPPPAIDPPAEALEPWAGEYRLASGERVSVESADGALHLRGRDPRSTALVFTPDLDDAGRAVLAARDADALAVVEGAYAGDDGPLRARISPSLPLEAAWGALRATVARLEAELGPRVECRPAGTAPSGSPGSARSVVELRHRDGARLLAVTWAGGRAIHLALAEAPPALACAPLSETDFASYDLFSGRSIRVGFRAEPDGARALVLGGRVLRAVDADARDGRR